MKRIISVTAMLLLFALPGIAQNYRVSGIILNEAGEPLPGATIQLLRDQKTTIADENGEFTFTALEGGKYSIHVRFVGYAPLTRDTVVMEDLEWVLIMQPSTLVSEAVVVKGTRAEYRDPVVYTDLSADDIRSDNRTQDIPYLLELTPSLVTTSDAGTGIGYTGLRIRGTDPSRINVTINGIPYNDSESHDVYWVDIPDFVSSVENIQVQRGIGTSTNGAAAFGANINIQTHRLKEQAYAEIHTTGGSFNTLKNTVSGGTGLIHDRFALDFRRSDLLTDGYIDRAFARMNSVFLSAGYYTPKSVLKITWFRGKELTYQAWGGVPAELLDTQRTFNPYTYENEVDDYLQSHFQLHGSHAFHSNLNANVAIHYTRGQGFYEQFKDEQDLADYLLDPVIVLLDTVHSTDLVRRKWLDNHFFGAIYNLNYTSDDLHVQAGGGINQYDGDHYGRIVWAEFASSADPSRNYYFSTGLKTDWNTFVKANYQVFTGFHLYADMQYRFIDYSIDGVDDDQRDLMQHHRYHFFNPKAGLVYRPADPWKIYIHAALGNREPKRSNFTDAAPGQEVRPERMTNYELGVQYQAGRLTGRVNSYLMDYTDQLVLTGEINDVGSPVMVNVPDSYRMGIELECAIQVLERLEWQGNATFSRNRIRNFVEFVDDWDTWSQREFELGETNLAFSPTFIAGSRVVFHPLSAVSISLDSKYVGKQYIDNTSSADKALDAYFLNDLVVSYSPDAAWARQVRLFVQVNNMFNHLYESNAWVYSYYVNGERDHMIGYYPQAGRHYLVGLGLAF